MTSYSQRYIQTYLNTFDVAVWFINPILLNWDGLNESRHYLLRFINTTSSNNTMAWLNPSRHLNSFSSLDPIQIARSSQSDVLIWWICMSWSWKVFWKLMAFQMRTKARWRVPGSQARAGLRGNLGGSWNGGTPKSSILGGFSCIIYCRGTPMYGKAYLNPWCGLVFFSLRANHSPMTWGIRKDA